MLYKAREAIIKLFDDYSTIASEAKYEENHWKGCPSDLATCLKILTLTEMLQSLPRALGHVKAGNAS